jgi:microcystin-dependent protein
MSLESVSFIDDFVITNPVGATDPKSEGDDHIRRIKTGVKATFPGMAGRAWRVQNKSSTYTVLATDNMTVINCTAALTLNLTAVATIGDGFLVVVKAAGGNATIDPDGSELINGAATVVVPDGSTAIIFCDAAAWVSIALGGVPSGTMLDYGGTSLPAGFLACDGAAVSRTTYATLFAAISTTWGVGDGSTTFNVPNLNRRTTVGSGGSGTGTLGNAVGNVGGAETHALTLAETPAHTHTYPAGGYAAFGGNMTGAVGFQGNYSTGSAGSNGAHNNVQPSAIVLKIIKV